MLAPVRAGIAVAGLTVVAFGLRLAQLDQSLVGDELFLYAIVHDSGPADVLRQVHETESTPPLHFLLAWLTAQVGDPTVSVRLPSLVAGTALVPATYALGRRTAGVPAALLAAALLAVAPAALLYGVEARAYAFLGLLAVLSTLALLSARDDGGAGRWTLFGALTLAILYTHYAGVFVVVAQTAWVAWQAPPTRRPLGLVAAGVAVGFAPWIPSFLVQRQDSAAVRIQELYDFTIGTPATSALKLLPGAPFFGLGDLPGTLPTAIFVAVSAAAALRLALMARARDPGPVRDAGLLAVIALATPVGAVLYSLGPESIYLPRNMIPSLPATVLLLALGIVRWGPRAGPLLAAVALAVTAYSTILWFQPERARPAYREVAELIEREGDPSDPVLEVTVHPGPLGDALRVQLDPAFEIDRLPHGARAAAARGQASGRLFLVVPQVGVLARTPRLAELRGFELAEQHRFEGFVPLAVFVYRARS